MLPDNVHNCQIHLVGIKGSGMTSLAEVLQMRGAILSGSDISEPFHTDTILRDLVIPYNTSFAKRHISANIQYVIYSRAWDNNENPEILAARERGIPLLSYNEALGSISRNSYTAAISGTHGKTSTTAIAAHLVRELNLPATVIAGGGMLNFNNHGVYHGGTTFSILEACEYQHSFLSLQPDISLITNIEWDHPDYYKNEQEVIQSFVALANLLPKGGTIIYSSASDGARQCVRLLQQENRDLRYYSYGSSPYDTYHISDVCEKVGETLFSLNGKPLHIRQPGQHLVDNAVAAIALVTNLCEMHGTLTPEHATIASLLERYKGIQRRSEIRARIHGIILVDDYAHHPTAIRKTLASYKQFFNVKRVIVDFMPHTFSRTEMFIDSFATAFVDADEVIINEIYASAREKYTGSINGEQFAAIIAHPSVHYEADFDAAAKYLHTLLQPGDLYVSMGAGNNWQITTKIIKLLQNNT